MSLTRIARTLPRLNLRLGDLSSQGLRLLGCRYVHTHVLTSMAARHRTNQWGMDTRTGLKSTKVTFKAIGINGFIISSHNPEHHGPSFSHVAVVFGARHVASDMPAHAPPRQPGFGRFGAGDGQRCAHSCSASVEDHCSTPVPPTQLLISPRGTVPPSVRNKDLAVNQHVAENDGSVVLFGFTCCAQRR